MKNGQPRPRLQPGWKLSSSQVPAASPCPCSTNAEPAGKVLVQGTLLRCWQRLPCTEKPWSGGARGQLLLRAPRGSGGPSPKPPPCKAPACVRPPGRVGTHWLIRSFLAEMDSCQASNVSLVQFLGSQFPLLCFFFFVFFSLSFFFFPSLNLNGKSKSTRTSIRTGPSIRGLPFPRSISWVPRARHSRGDKHRATSNAVTLPSLQPRHCSFLTTATPGTSDTTSR